ncbi:hypothetical protein BDR07DRAFT_1412052, partial [Suillus spraguei]
MVGTSDIILVHEQQTGSRRRQRYFCHMVQQYQNDHLNHSVLHIIQVNRLKSQAVD